MHKRSIPYNKTRAKHTWSQKNIIVTQENIAEMSQKYSFLSRIESCMCAANLTLPAPQKTPYLQWSSIMLWGRLFISRSWASC